MGQLKVNTIANSSGNNIAMQDSLNLKSYTTTPRNGLTSSAGDMIYNETNNKVQCSNGTAGNDL